MKLFFPVLYLCLGELLNSALPLSATQDPNYPLVSVPGLGRLRGITTWAFFTGRPIYQFLGVNYARSPSGRRRFQVDMKDGMRPFEGKFITSVLQPPETFEPWTGVYNATKMRQACPQIAVSYYPSPDPRTLDIKADIEDCLVVNVFTPKLPQPGDSLLPVLYMIHGGSLAFGSAYDFHPEFLLEKDIVLVVVQYRLGALGFMSLQTDEIPGNAGMLDIISGLFWVQKHIKNFGGDSSSVTVVGQSAGAAAASALLVSPLVKPESRLFHRVVIQSGSAISTWVVDNNPVYAATRIAQLSGCLSQDLKVMAECLKHVPAMNLVRSHLQYVRQDVAMGGLGNAASGLVVQKAGRFKVLDETPQDSFARGNFIKVPMMGGSTRDEGTSFLSNIFDVYSISNETDPSYFHRNMTRDVLRYCGYHDGSGALTDFYQYKYFGGPTESFDEMSAGLVDICGTLLLKASTYHTVRLLSQFEPCFIYSFNYFGNVSKLRSAHPNWKEDYPFPAGVAHSDEMGYLFPMPGHRYTDRELIMVKTMVAMWTNFVIKGKPIPAPSVPHWPVMSTEFGPYLRITDVSEIRASIMDEYTVTSREGHISNSPSHKPFMFGYLSIICLIVWR